MTTPHFASLHFIEDVEEKVPIAQVPPILHLSLVEGAELGVGGSRGE